MAPGSLVEPRGPELLALRTQVMEATSNNNACAPPSADFKSIILRFQAKDAHANHIHGLITAKGDPTKDTVERQRYANKKWRIANSLLLQGDAIYIPPMLAGQHKIMRMHYNDPYAGHFGREKTVELIKHYFYWDSLYINVKEYVKTCALY
jgi:hypothetical protein